MLKVMCFEEDDILSLLFLFHREVQMTLGAVDVLGVSGELDDVVRLLAVAIGDGGLPATPAASP